MANPVKAEITDDLILTVFRGCMQQPVIAKGTPLPAMGRQAFTTSINNQQVIVFEVRRHQPEFSKR